jgi:putative ABC transport system ATP-binding protein
MIKLKNIKKYYGSGNTKTEVLKGINLEIKEGEFIALMGPSGSGKSTLMNILGTLDIPTSGEYYLENSDVSKLNSTQRAMIRRYIFGFVFQSFNLLKKTSALDNVQVPLIYQGIPKKERIIKAKKALEEVDLGNRINHLTNQLSGGQQQRVAIARAIVTNPKILFADEPTGNLDSVRSIETMELLKALNNKGITIIMVTHEEEMAQYASKIVHIKDGVLC